MSIDIGIADGDRFDIARGLARVLADSYTLYLETHRFHWNVTGPMFNTLHAMFMQQYTELWGALDLIAERIRSLGHPAPGSYAEFARLASIAQATENPPADGMIRALLAGHEALIRTLRGVLPAANRADDQATLDLITQRLQIHEKTAWMLRTLLEG